MENNSVEELKARINELERALSIVSGTDMEKIRKEIAVSDAADMGLVHCDYPKDQKMYESCAELKVDPSDPLSQKLPEYKLCRCKIEGVRCAYSQKIVLRDKSTSNKELSDKISRLEMGNTYREWNQLSSKNIQAAADETYANDGKVSSNVK